MKISHQHLPFPHLRSKLLTARPWSDVQLLILFQEPVESKMITNETASGITHGRFDIPCIGHNSRTCVCVRWSPPIIENSHMTRVLGSTWPSLLVYAVSELATETLQKAVADHQSHHLAWDSLQLLLTIPDTRCIINHNSLFCSFPTITRRHRRGHEAALS
jgi:hypothetical protein